MGRKKPSAPSALPPEPPVDLSEPSKALWRDVVGKCRTPGRRAMLAESLLARDRAAKCRAQVDADGMTSVTARSGAVHTHPLLPLEVRFRAQFLGGFHSLGLSSQATTFADLSGD